MQQLTRKEDNVQTLPQQQIEGINPMAAAILARGDASIETLERLLTLQERHEANEARKAYNVAMSKFREDLRPAKKSGKNGHLKTTYATFDDIVRAVSMPLSDHGFNYSFKQDQSEQRALTVTCTITHEGGHSDSTTLTSSIEGNKGINGLQALGLTASYLKRYTLTALTGVATEDSDGEMPPATTVELCDDADFADIRAACESVDKDYDKWVSWKGQAIPILDGKLQLPKAHKAAAIAQITKAAK